MLPNLALISRPMEQHPVPQNVTTFQFRLVGDMTIKQFGYLAGGIIGGYICYKLPLPFFFTWPLAISSGLLGFGLAFVPVEERPMDVWIASFFKNVYSPTQWVWQKEKRVQTKSTHPATPSPTPDVKGPPTSGVLRAPQPTPPATSASRAILSMRHTTSPLDWIRSLFHATAKPVAPSLTPGFSFADALAARSAPSVIGKRPDLTEAQKPVTPSAPQPMPPTSDVRTSFTPEVSHVPATSAQPSPQPVAHDRVVELQGQLSEALAQRERLEHELIAMRQRIDQQAKVSLPTPTRQAGVAGAAPIGPSTSVRVIAPDGATKAGLPRLTTFPNVVTGIVKDHWGNLLAGMLITVRDKDDVPLRALKTNKLGQFAASTPLPNGTYMVEIEDPKDSFVFDKIQIPLAGSVAPPIEVIAKSQKQVERDKLAREIFGQNQI